MAGDLEVTFIDEIHLVDAPGQVSFGRDADIAVDESNAYMHRRVGSFVHHDGAWWVRNDGRTIELIVVTDTGARITLAPGSSQALTGRSGLVRFEAGGLAYELEYAVAAPAGPPSAATAELSRGETRDFASLRLNTEQRQMLAALAEPQLRDPAAEGHEMPTNAEVAHRLGWSLRKFDRKLDYICRRLDDEGVRGVRGRQGDQATDRRRVVVDHVLADRADRPRRSDHPRRHAVSARHPDSAAARRKVGGAPRTRGPLSGRTTGPWTTTEVTRRSVGLARGVQVRHSLHRDGRSGTVPSPQVV